MFDIGQKVVVTTKGRSYTSYDKWAEVHDLKNYKSSAPKDDGTEYKVTSRGYHGNSDNKLLYAIQDADGIDYIINGEGIGIAPAYEYQWLYSAKQTNGSLSHSTTGFFKSEDEAQEHLARCLPTFVSLHSRIEESKREVKS